MVIHTPPATADDFSRFILLPENADRNFELLAGEIIEKMVSSPRSSAIGAFMVIAVGSHAYQHGLGRVTGADGGYVVGNDRYIPDAAYIAKARQPVPPTEAYNPLAPDLAVEVLSPSDNPYEVRLKIANYLAAGTVVWLIDPEMQQVEVYVSGQPARVFGINDTLEGGDVLPGFTLAVSRIFAE